MCPFCSHLSESLRVDATEHIWYCDACKSGGDTITWLMTRHGLTFRAALEQIAEIHGVELERRFDGQR